jgi:hypothetical protein
VIDSFSCRRRFSQRAVDDASRMPSALGRRECFGLDVGPCEGRPRGRPGYASRFLPKRACCEERTQEPKVTRSATPAANHAISVGPWRREKGRWPPRHGPLMRRSQDVACPTPETQLPPRPASTNESRSLASQESPMGRANLIAPCRCQRSTGSDQPTGKAAGWAWSYLGCLLVEQPPYVNSPRMILKSGIHGDGVQGFSR